MRADPRLLLLGLGLVGTPALAYNLLSWNWAWQQAPMSDPFYVNPSAFPAAIGTQTEVTNALRDGMEIWGDEGGANFAFNYAGTTNQSSFANDNVFISQFSSQTAQGGTLAVSQSWGWGDEMTDCDQRYYRANAYGTIAWSADPNGAAWNEFDLMFTAMHEFGHCAGLDHSSNNNAVMKSFATGGEGPADRHLHADDEAGLQAAYGRAAAPAAGLVLEQGGMFIAGSAQTVTIRGANAGERIHLLVGTGGVGAGPCPAALGGQCLGIRSPYNVVAQRNANNQGVATFTITPPTNYGGWQVALQAGVLRGAGGAQSLLSNAEEAMVLAAGTTCSAGRTPDCNGNCYDSSWVGDGGCDDGTTYQWGNPDFACAAFAYDDGDCP